MSNRIIPVDQSMLGKVNQKPGKVAATEASSMQPVGQSARAESVNTSDTVELTGNAKLLAQAEHSLAALPPIDASKVAQVQRAILAGEYVIDAEKITDALLKADLEIGK